MRRSQFFTVVLLIIATWASTFTTQLILYSRSKNADASQKQIISQLDLTDPNSSLSTILTTIKKDSTDGLKDNSQQTFILCTLILGQNIYITGTDATKVESICKEKIRELSKSSTLKVTSQTPHTSTKSSKAGSGGSQPSKPDNPSNPSALRSLVNMILGPLGL